MNIKFFLACLSLFFYASFSQAESSPPLKVGMLLPLTGGYQDLGTDCRQGIDLALEIIPNRIQPVYADSKALAEVALTEFRRLVDGQNVSAVFVMRGPCGMAVNPASLKLGIPLLGGIGNKDFAAQNQFAFQVWSRSNEEGEFIAKSIVEDGFNRVGVLTAQDDWTNSVSLGFRAALKSTSLNLLHDQEFTPQDNDFRSIIVQLKAKEVQAVFVNLALTQLGPFLRQAKDLKLNAQIYANFFLGKKDTLLSAGEAAEGAKFVEMDTELPKFRKRLKEKFDAVPSGATLAAYTATLLLAQAAAANPAPKTREELYQSLLQQSEVRMPDGSLKVEDRLIKFPLTIKVIQQGIPITQLHR